MSDVLMVMAAGSEGAESGAASSLNRSSSESRRLRPSSFCSGVEGSAVKWNHPLTQSPGASMHTTCLKGPTPDMLHPSQLIAPVHQQRLLGSLHHVLIMHHRYHGKDVWFLSGNFPLVNPFRSEHKQAHFN